MFQMCVVVEISFHHTTFKLLNFNFLQYQSLNKIKINMQWKSVIQELGLSCIVDSHMPVLLAGFSRSTAETQRAESLLRYLISKNVGCADISVQQCITI